jgi:hypothetical protein
MTSDGPAAPFAQGQGVKPSAVRDALNAGPTVLQALLAVGVLVGATQLGLAHVLDGQTVGVIYVAILGHVFREAVARRTNTKNGED